MLSTKQAFELSEIEAPLLTVYLNTDPAEAANRRSMPGYLSWIRKEAQNISRDVLPQEQGAFRQQVERIEEYLRDRKSTEKSMLILSGPTTWKPMPFHVPVGNELHWGRPALAQLLSLTNGGGKTSCVVAVDRARARFFAYAPGEMMPLSELKFDVNTSQWRRKEHSHMARQGTKMPHGPQRDAYKQRMDAQYLHLCQQVAEQTKRLCKKEGFTSVALVGSKRLTEPILEELPAELRENASLITQDFAKVDSADMAKRIAPGMKKWANEQAARRVDQLLGSGRGTVVGVDETLAQVQSGRVGTMVAASGFDARLKRCEKCGVADRSADPACPACGSARKTMMLSEILPELERAYRTAIEIVQGTAAKKLRDTGGIAGWLRQPKPSKQS
jgi:Bacterial archaeo-eukaryotic release factor family 10